MQTGQKAFAAVHDFVMATARASLIRRNINFLLSPYKAAADADAKVIRLTDARKKAAAAVVSAREPFYKAVDTDTVYKGGPSKAEAIAALQSELKGEQGKVKTAKESFQTIVAEGSPSPSQ